MVLSFLGPAGSCGRPKIVYRSVHNLGRWTCRVKWNNVSIGMKVQQARTQVSKRRGDRAVQSPAPRRGRPRAFDADQALDRALRVFWEKGFEGASLPDLTRAMGINRPSLYAAFGNKQSLFRKAMERYATGPASYIFDALAQPTARAVAQRLLLGGVEMVTCPKNPRGCFMVQGALPCGDSADCMRKAMQQYREAGLEKIRQRLERAKSEGDLPPDSDPADLARYLATVMHGIAVHAASGATPDQLRRVAQTALRAW